MISESIVEVYEIEQPMLCSLIQSLVSKGETFNKFKVMMKGNFPDWRTSITYSASLTIFKYYSNLKNKPMGLV